MGDKINNGMGFQNIGISNCCQSSSMSINPYFSSAWDDDDDGDPVVTLNQHHHHQSVGGGEFNYQGISSTCSHLAHYPPAADSTSYVQLLPKYPSYGSGSFSDMVGSFGLTDSSQFTNTSTCNNEETTDHHVQSRQEAVVVVGASPDGIGIGRRRKQMPADSTSPYHDPNKNISEDSKEQDEKKSTSEQNHASKQANKKSHSGETPKENYIHVRARRGQATNSHSLAERVRREKISERMRLLQELVPGCNKITGKALMLDEIINYVQSLQQQVEFLSMKLATVNPELNIDIDRILSKDIIHSRGRNAAIVGLNPGMNSHPYSHGFFPASIQVVPNTNPQLFAPHVHHNVLENNLQTLLQMGFESSSAMDNLLGPKDR